MVFLLNSGTVTVAVCLHHVAHAIGLVCPDGLLVWGAV